MKFLKDNLKMSEKDRNSLNINAIFQSKKDNAQIMYIRCETPDDISLITSHLKHMEHSNLKSAPTTVTHIPKALFKRYQHCEKLLYKLRISKDKTIQTNLRMGRMDFQLRQRTKGDQTPWKDIPILKIPENAPGPEMDLITEENEEILTEKLSSQLEEDDKSKNWSKSDNIENLESTHMSNTNGSVTNQLRHKHNLSETDTPKISPKKSRTEAETTENNMSPESQVRKLIPNVTIQRVNQATPTPTKTKQQNKHSQTP